MANTTLTPCALFYFVDLDSNSRPIVDTMSAKSNNKIPAGYKCNMARVTGENMPTPDGYVQCTNGLRYWYQLKFVPNGTGTTSTVIVPNSMRAIHGVPKSSQNGYCWIEYKIFEPIV